MSVGLIDARDRVAQPPSGRLKDYVLEEYEPAASREGRLHSLSALRFFLRAHGWLERLEEPIAALRSALGSDETVWGVKTLPGGHPGIELYFYNHCRNAPGSPKSVTRLKEILRPFIAIDGGVDERLPYLMCSLEIDPDVIRDRRAPGFRVYVAGKRDHEGYDGVSYLATRGELRRENLYYFYSAKSDLSLVRERLRGSWRAGEASAREALLDPNMLDCFTICFAQKAQTDALYFSRVRLAQALPRLEHDMPGAMTDMLRAHAHDFAHLRWDVGYDFAAPAGDLTRAEIQKVGLYGYF